MRASEEFRITGNPTVYNRLRRQIKVEQKEYMRCRRGERYPRLDLHHNPRRPSNKPHWHCRACRDRTNTIETWVEAERYLRRGSRYFAINYGSYNTCGWPIDVLDYAYVYLIDQPYGKYIPKRS